MRSPSSSFSPLFIGEYSATTANKICFILRSNLSVPSSSGNTLQPALERLGWNEARVSFSPLFIGEYSATLRLPPHLKSQFSLSVPSSSGNTLQRRADETAVREHLP